MERQKQQLAASVMASVLVVGTLMLVGMLMVMEWWEMGLTRCRFYQHEEQVRADVEAGFLLYTLDSTLQRRWKPDSSLTLYGDRKASRVYFTCRRWGMYEAITVTADGGRGSSTRLLGKTWESYRRATLYIPENHRSFALTGRSFVSGRLYLPRDGISYSQIRSEFFNGRRVKEEMIEVSSEEFPEMDAENRALVDELLSFVKGEERAEYGSVWKRNFQEEPVWVAVGENLSGITAVGQVIFYSPDALFVGQDNRLEDVIVAGRKVEIADGFTGSLQVFARDTILLGERVVLKPGSGLYVKRSGAEGFLRLGAYNEVNGYIVVESLPVDEAPKQAAYLQPETARVRGLVYVDGIAEVHGIVTGSLYARDCYYFAPEGYYPGVLYNAVLSGNPGLPYPFLMTGPYERKEVKWLD